MCVHLYIRENYVVLLNIHKIRTETIKRQTHYIQICTIVYEVQTSKTGRLCSSRDLMIKIISLANKKKTYKN